MVLSVSSQVLCIIYNLKFFFFFYQRVGVKLIGVSFLKKNFYLKTSGSRKKKHLQDHYEKFSTTEIIMTQENQVEQQQKSEFKDEVPKEQSRVERGDTPFTFGQRVLKSDDDIWNHNAW